MKNQNIDSLFSLIIKYIWLICLIIIALEIVLTSTTAIMFTKTASEDTIISATREIENQLDVAWKLGNVLANDETITDTSISLEDRILGLDKYIDTYNLFLIGLTDENGVITSTYRNVLGDIGYRDYFQYSMTTGETVVTDVFSSGANETILNYTICIPYYNQENTPAGAVIMSILFDDINDIITNSIDIDGFNFTLLDSNDNVMAEQEQRIMDMNFTSVLGESSYLSSSEEEIMDSIHNEDSGSYWTIDQNRLLYVSHLPIESTPWTLIMSTNFLSSNSTLFIAALVKTLLIILILIMMEVFGKRYANTKLQDTRDMLLQMEKLQMNLLEEKLITSSTLEELIDISKSGLIDELTSLPTRMSIKKKIDIQLKQLPQYPTSVFLLIDLDDFKTINDLYGHAIGDTAISYLGKALKQWAEESNGLIGRFGGDEFIAFFTSDDYELIIQRLLTLLRIEFTEDGNTITLHASIGCAIYDASNTDFQQLYINADKALYNAKRKGKDCYTFFDKNTVIK